MKKILGILVIAFALKASLTNAQTIPNTGFEQLNSDGSLQNWGNVYLMQAGILDSSGMYHGDSIVFGNQYYYYAPTHDAHTGTTAMELSNSRNFTNNQSIAGAASVDDDTVFSSWGALNLIPIQAAPSGYRPFNFAFYYKYFPENGDSAYAQMAMWDSTGTQIGEGSVIITNITTTYTYSLVTIHYTSQNTVAFYSLGFSAFYTSSQGSHQPAMGTRLLVDDVTFDGAALGISNQSPKSEIKIYPNPTNNVLNIQSEFNSEIQYSICNAFGQMVTAGSLPVAHTAIPLNDLSPGFYTIELIEKSKTLRGNFMISR
jgi:hypothetical protein